MGAELGNLIGRRIRFLHTDDPYIKLRFGSPRAQLKISQWHHGMIFEIWSNGMRV